MTGRTVRTKIVTYPNGKRVRLGFDYYNRVVEHTVMPRVKVTKSRKKLNNRRRRIGLR